MYKQRKYCPTNFSFFIIRSDTSPILPSSFAPNSEYLLLQFLDVALYKQTQQSSTYSNSTRYYGSSKAVDGKKATNLDQLSCAYTEYKENSWWEVDFGMVHNVTGVEITAASFEDGVKNFNITVNGKL